MEFLRVKCPLHHTIMCPVQTVARRAVNKKMPCTDRGMTGLRVSAGTLPCITIQLQQKKRISVSFNQMSSMAANLSCPTGSDSQLPNAVPLSSMPALLDALLELRPDTGNV